MTFYGLAGSAIESGSVASLRALRNFRRWHAPSPRILSS